MMSSLEKSDPTKRWQSQTRKSHSKTSPCKPESCGSLLFVYSNSCCITASLTLDVFLSKHQHVIELFKVAQTWDWFIYTLKLAHIISNLAISNLIWWWAYLSVGKTHSTKYHFTRNIRPHTWTMKQGRPFSTWMSQEVSKRLGSVGYNPNIPHL